MRASTEAIRVIEKLQEDFIVAQGHDPKDVQKLVKDMENCGGKKPPKLPDQTLDEFCCLIYNEYSYCPDDTLKEHFFNPTVTKYDKVSILNRLPNLIFFCRKYFGEAAPSIDPIFSTLPTSILNGFCLDHKSVGTLILLNEGILYSAPQFVEVFQKIPTDICNQVAEAKIPITPEQAHRLKHAMADFLGVLLYFSSNHSSPISMELSPGKPYLPMGFETWKVRLSIESSLTKTYPKDYFTENILHESFNNQQEKYYMLRGLLLFLVAHEYSHFARQHTEMIRRRATIVAPEYLTENIEFLRQIRPENGNLEPSQKSKEMFVLSQPLEMQADADAISIVARYCDEHGLSKEQKQAVYSGVALFFTLSEMLEHMLLVSKFGIEKTQSHTMLAPIERNLLFPREHPVPMSRIPMCICNATALSQTQKEEIENYFVDALVKAEVLWASVSPNAFHVISSDSFEFSSMLRMDLPDALEGLNALGAKGLPDISEPIKMANYL